MTRCKACGKSDHVRSTSHKCIKPGTKRENAWRLFQAGGRAYCLLWWFVQNIKALRPSQSVARLPTDRLEDRYVAKGTKIVAVRSALSSETLFQGLVHVVGPDDQRARHAAYFTAKWVLGRAADKPALRPALPPEMVARILPFIWGDNPLVEPTPGNRVSAWLPRPVTPKNGRPGRLRIDGFRSRPLQVSIPSALVNVVRPDANGPPPFFQMLERIAAFERAGPAFFGGGPLVVHTPPTYKKNEHIPLVYPPNTAKRAKPRIPRLPAGYWYHNQAVRTLLGLPVAEAPRTGALKVFVHNRWTLKQPAELRVPLSAPVTVDDVLLFLSTPNFRLSHAAILRSTSSFEWVDEGALFRDVIPRPIDWGSPALCPAGGVPCHAPFPIMRAYAANANVCVMLRCMGVDPADTPTIKGVLEARCDWKDVLL